MNKNLRVVALLGALAGVTACQSDFLTENPTSSIAPTNFYKTQNDALSALTSAYGTFINLHSPLGTADYFGRNMLMLIEYPTEVVTSRLSAGNERSQMGGFNSQLFTSSHAYLLSTWEAAYFGINRANTVIERVPAIEMDPTRRDQIVAEAKFLRAMHYYWLAGLFGGVPLKLTETQTIGDAPPARASAAETWAQIEKDLTEAAAVLPVSWPAGDFGRATKGGALTLLGKAYLQSAATGAGGAADYQKAEAAFRQVLTLGYTLDPNYGSLFDGSNEKSKEIIWSIQNVRVTGAGGYYSQWFAPITAPVIYTPGPQNQFQAERPFYDSYNPNDKRKDQTWLTSFVNNGKTVAWTWTASPNPTTSATYGSTGPVPRKYLDFGAAANGAEAPDVVVLRLGDVLLSLAEVIDANAGPTAEAYGFVNQVRARSSVPNLTPGLSAAAFKDSVFAERRFELVVEGHGIFDSRRNWTWAKGRVEANMALISTLNKSPFTSSVEKFDGRPISDKWRLYPIPAHACELNPALSQNPGWEDGICKNPGS